MNRISIVVIIYFLCHPSFSFACSCKSPSSIEKSFKEATAVFVGRVLARREDAKQGAVHAVSIQEAYKGIPESDTRVVSVISGPADSQCLFRGERGTSYIWYVDKDDATYKVSLCSRSKLLSAGHDEVLRLRELVETTTQEKDTQEVNQ